MIGRIPVVTVPKKGIDDVQERKIIEARQNIFFEESSANSDRSVLEFLGYEN